MRIDQSGARISLGQGAAACLGSHAVSSLEDVDRETCMLHRHRLVGVVVNCTCIGFRLVREQTCVWVVKPWLKLVVFGLGLLAVSKLRYLSEGWKAILLWSLC